MNAPERRLQVIVFTDVKGYTAMMSADEATTVRVVAEHRELGRALLARHGGREIRTVGDAFLILFDAVVPAMSWATEVQEALLARNAALPARMDGDKSGKPAPRARPVSDAPWRRGGAEALAPGHPRPGRWGSRRGDA